MSTTTLIGLFILDAKNSTHIGFIAH